MSLYYGNPKPKKASLVRWFKRAIVAIALYNTITILPVFAIVVLIITLNLILDSVLGLD